MDNSRFQMKEYLNLYTKQKHGSQLSHVLEMCFVSAMHEDETPTIIMSYINKLLSTSVDRQKGFVLLDKIMLYCPLTILCDNAVKWASICLNYSAKEQLSNLRFHILVKLLQLSAANQDINKSFLSIIPGMINMCISANNENSLQCLKVCLDKYPNTCGPFKSKIEVYLLKFFTSQSQLCVMKKAASVFVSLQQVGGAGPNGITHRTNWSNQTNKLCATLHKLYDNFFEGIMEFERKEIDVQVFEFALSPMNDSAVAPFVMANRLRNILVFLNCMLLERFPVIKAIPIGHILDVIKRGLTIDMYGDSRNSLEETQLAALLYEHQIDLVYLLRGLIACTKKHSVPYSLVITKLLVDCLARSQKTYFKSSVKYQKAVYSVLRYWIVIVESKICVTMRNKILSSIMFEITPVKANLTLCLNPNLSKNNSKKAKKRTLQEAMSRTYNDNSISAMTKLSGLQELVCIEALKTGIILLRHVVLQFDQEMYKGLPELIIHQLLDLQSEKVTPPFNNPKCQAYLYDFLVALLVQPCFCVSPILETAIVILTKAQARLGSCNNDHVFIACSRGLNVLEKLCQPVCPTLCIDMYMDDEKLENNKAKKKTFETDEEITTNLPVSDDPISSKYTHMPNGNHDILLDNVTSTSSSPKINVLSMQIIKQANSENGNSQLPEIDEEVQSQSIELEVEIQEPQEINNGGIPGTDIFIDFKNEVEEVVNIEIVKEPDTGLDEDDCDMLASFTDIIN